MIRLSLVSNPLIEFSPFAALFLLILPYAPLELTSLKVAIIYVYIFNYPFLLLPYCKVKITGAIFFFFYCVDDPDLLGLFLSLIKNFLDNHSPCPRSVKYNNNRKKIYCYMK